MRGASLGYTLENERVEPIHTRIPRRVDVVRKHDPPSCRRVERVIERVERLSGLEKVGVRRDGRSEGGQRRSCGRSFSWSTRGVTHPALMERPLVESVQRDAAMLELCVPAAKELLNAMPEEFTTDQCPGKHRMLL